MYTCVSACAFIYFYITSCVSVLSILPVRLFYSFQTLWRKLCRTQLAFWRSRYSSIYRPMDSGRCWRSAILKQHIRDFLSFRWGPFFSDNYSPHLPFVGRLGLIKQASCLTRLFSSQTPELPPTLAPIGQRTRGPSNRWGDPFLKALRVIVSLVTYGLGGPSQSSDITFGSVIGRGGGALSCARVIDSFCRSVCDGLIVNITTCTRSM